MSRSTTGSIPSSSSFADLLRLRYGYDLEAFDAGELAQRCRHAAEGPHRSRFSENNAEEWSISSLSFASEHPTFPSIAVIFRELRKVVGFSADRRTRPVQTRGIISQGLEKMTS